MSAPGSSAIRAGAGRPDAAETGRFVRAPGRPGARMSESTIAASIPWIRVHDAAEHVGQAIELRGWVTHRRSSGKVQFLVVRDGSGQIQCVAGVRDLSPEQWEASAALTQES